MISLKKAKCAPPKGLLPLALAGYMLYLWINWRAPLLFSQGEEYLSIEGQNGILK